MSRTIYLTLPKALLLPQHSEFRLELGYAMEYYDFLVRVVCVVRDSFSEVSLYRGESYEDYVILFLEDLMALAPEAYRLCNQYLGEVLSCAMQLNTLLPAGIFEKLDLFQVNMETVSFIGVLHAVDYR